MIYIFEFKDSSRNAILCAKPRIGLIGKEKICFQNSKIIKITFMIVKKKSSLVDFCQFSYNFLQYPHLRVTVGWKIREIWA